MGRLATTRRVAQPFGAVAARRLGNRFGQRHGNMVHPAGALRHGAAAQIQDGGSRDDRSFILRAGFQLKAKNLKPVLLFRSFLLGLGYPNYLSFVRIPSHQSLAAQPATIDLVSAYSNPRKFRPLLGLDPMTR